MNKTVHQSSNHCNWIFFCALMSLYPHVFVVSLSHVLFETKIGCEELPTMMFNRLFSLFAKQEESHAVINHSRPQLFC